MPSLYALLVYEKLWWSPITQRGIGGGPHDLLVRELNAQVSPAAANHVVAFGVVLANYRRRNLLLFSLPDSAGGAISFGLVSFLKKEEFLMMT